MKLNGHTVLITGGASGIGFAIAEHFIKAGNEVIICGRREDKLKEAKNKYSQLVTFQCDVSEASERVRLFNWVKEKFPRVNILVNNAGIQDRFKLDDLNGDWTRHHQEIAINLEAPLHLSMLFVSHLQNLPASAIVNVSSGLAFVPLTIAPVYSATKAALHSFTLSLRHLLSSTNIEVIEIIPPAVQTDLGGHGLHTFGVPLQEFADSIMKRLENGEQEIGFGLSEKSRNASRSELDEIFKNMNNR